MPRSSTNQNQGNPFFSKKMEQLLSLLQYDLSKHDIIWRGHLPFSPERSLLCPMQTPKQTCLVYESIAEHSLFVFVMTLLVVTAVHWIAIQLKRAHVKNEGMTQKHGGSSVLKMLLTILCFFPVFLPPLVQFQQFEWAKPFGSSLFLQMIGTLIVYGCTLSFVMVHVSMGEAWSPVPEALQEHKLVTSGSFRFARHPMYATFAICLIPGSGLATMNWLIALTGVPIFLFFVIIRIPQEEAILQEIFHDDYLRYMERVGSIGPKWLCFWEKKKYSNKKSK
jgi:protein-S-isoprenylcysteine O-methyltransferase Ste14